MAAHIEEAGTKTGQDSTRQELIQLLTQRASTIYDLKTAPEEWELDALVATVPDLLDATPESRDLANEAMFLSDQIVAYRGLKPAWTLLQATQSVFVGLADADPSNSGWQRDLWVSYCKMAAAVEKSGTGGELEWWRKAYETLAATKQRGVMLPTDEQYLQQLRAKANIE